MKKWNTIQKLGEALRSDYPDWHLVLLSQSWMTSSSGDPIWLREVLHQSGDRPLVYARVTVPKRTFDVFSQTLLSLGNRSIGDHFLFVRSDVKRSAIESIQLVEGEAAYDAAVLHLKETGPFEGRRSRFWIGEYDLEITEYFNKAGGEIA